MNTNDLLVNWSALSMDEIENRLETGADEAAATQLFGAGEVAEMQTLAAEPRAKGARKSVVLLPGMMGSLLSSIRGMTALLWINPALFLKGQSSYLELHEDGTRDRHPGIEAMPIALERMSYTKIALALRRQVDLYEFPYDWRRPIEYNGDLLHQYIERWADGDPDRKFTLVGHSMGGLVSRAYLARHTEAAERRIERLIMHGTPHFGAGATMENLVNGNRMMALAGKLNSKNTPDRLLLNMPSVYQLLPAPPDLFPAHRRYPSNWDLYDAKSWRLEGIRQDYLDLGKAFYEMLASTDPQVETIEIAGCNVDTIVDVKREFEPGERLMYDVIRQQGGADGGDGTVPLWSALLPGATIYYAEEVHRDLPKNKKVIQATLDLIHGGMPDLDTELPPFDPGWFPFDTPEPVGESAEKLRANLEEGTASAKDLSQLYFAF
jgi:pimeloyl-ACP methyl ester carboxylesterase